MIRTEQVHGTSVDFDGKGILILGPSGAGKSTLALELMACGASLVSDDITNLEREAATIFAFAPAPLRGRIEARHVGILSAQTVTRSALRLVIDLGQSESERLPPKRHYQLLELAVPLVLGPYRPHFYASVKQLLLFGREN